MAVVKWMERRPELCSSEGGRNRLGGEGTGDGKGNAAQSQGGVRFFLREGPGCRMGRPNKHFLKSSQSS